MTFQGEMPLFRLRSGDGQDRGTLDAWQRRDMVIALLHGSDCQRCREFLAGAAARAGAWWSEEIAFFAVQRAPSHPSVARYVLLDPDGARWAQVSRVAGVGGNRAAVVIANRFGELCAALDPHSADAGEMLAEVESWLDLAQRQCGECQPPLQWE